MLKYLNRPQHKKTFNTLVRITLTLDPGNQEPSTTSETTIVIRKWRDRVYQNPKILYLLYKKT